MPLLLPPADADKSTMKQRPLDAKKSKMNNLPHATSGGYRDGYMEGR
jgi:hypothetical protein